MIFFVHEPQFQFQEEITNKQQELFLLNQIKRFKKKKLKQSQSNYEYLNNGKLKMDKKNQNCQLRVRVRGNGHWRAKPGRKGQVIFCVDHFLIWYMLCVFFHQTITNKKKNTKLNWIWEIIYQYISLKQHLFQINWDPHI